MIDLWPTKDAAETGAGSEAQCYAASPVIVEHRYVLGYG
ncbi:hypothetical protein [Azospirillum endophyticum]